MRVAFKEWAIVVDALGRGEQILILRKGGIHEGRTGFDIEHQEFLLFPTLFHQQRDLVLPPAQVRFDQIAPFFPEPDHVLLEFFAKVVHWQKIDSFESLLSLEGQHIWRSEVIEQRFQWGKAKSIFALAVRIFRLPQPNKLPLQPEYAGCKSWVELEQEIPLDDSKPVLSDEVFANKLEAFRAALSLTVSSVS